MGKTHGRVRLSVPEDDFSHGARVQNEREDPRKSDAAGVGPGALLLGLLLVGCASGGPAPPSSVQIDLGSAAIDSAVPFDAPIVLKGTAPKETIDITSQIATAPLQCEFELPGAAENTKAACASPPDNATDTDTIWIEDATAIWRNQNIGDDPPNFSLLIPPLSSGQAYVLKLTQHRKPTEAQVNAFQASARVSISRVLARFANATATQAAVQDLRRDLAAALDGAAGGNPVRTAGTVLDLSRPYQDVRADFAEHATAILEAQMNAASSRSRIGATDDAATLVGAVKAGLDALERQEALVRLAVGLRTRLRSRDAAVTTLMAGYPDVLGFLEAVSNDNSRRAIATGAAADGDPLDWSDISDTTAVGATVGRYEATVSSLYGVESLLRALLGDNSSQSILSRMRADGLLGANDRAELATLSGGTLLQAARDKIERPNGVLNEIALLRGYLRAEAKGVTDLVAIAKVEAEASALVHAATHQSFKSAADTYFALDAGAMLIPELSEAGTFIALSSYFYPVNKDVSLAPFFSSEDGDWRRRLSVLTGMTVQSIESESDPSRLNLFDTRAALVGLGWRLTDNVRLTVGGVIFQQDDVRTPLKKERDLVMSEFYGLSLDVDIGDYLKAFGSLFDKLLPSSGGG